MLGLVAPADLSSLSITGAHDLTGLLGPFLVMVDFPATLLKKKVLKVNIQYVIFFVHRIEWDKLKNYKYFEVQL